MIFLVRIAALVEQNRVRGRELHAEGALRDLWRLPGRRASVSIWSAADADALDAALRSLPISAHVDMEVTALATHPMLAEV